MLSPFVPSCALAHVMAMACLLPLLYRSPFISTIHHRSSQNPRRRFCSFKFLVALYKIATLRDIFGRLEFSRPVTTLHTIACARPSPHYTL